MTLNERTLKLKDLIDGDGRFGLGALVRKSKGSNWHGTVVGFYTTDLTDVGYVVESAYEVGSCQIYPSSALEPWDGL